MASLASTERAKALLSTAGTVVASAIFVRSIINDFLPDEVREYLGSTLRGIVSWRSSSQFVLVIEEFRGFSPNQVFDAVNSYLGTIAGPSSASIRRAKVGKDDQDKEFAVTMDADEEVTDIYENVDLKWRLVHTKVESYGRANRLHESGGGDLNASLRSEVRSFELSFHKKHKDTVLNRYLPYVLERSRALEQERRAVKLRIATNYGAWDTDNVATLHHPMTFDTLAMDPDLKRRVLEDLDNFINGKEYYQKIGKVWKRGYLLYGPPGTGKSSLIAAMSNHLNFDIYNLDLSSVESDLDLKTLMVSMSGHSMLVIEDIDCSIKIQNRESDKDGDQQSIDPDKKNKVTLSGLLNFVDGLLSCCKEAVIIVFTTNHREQLDPALLRPGRMDMHICLSYCTVSVFRQLAFNYLGIKHHHLYEEIERLMEDVQVTPAEVGGELMKSRDPEVSLRGLFTFLQIKSEHHLKGDDSTASTTISAST